MKTPTADSQVHPASYRDPAGFVFTVDGTLYRQVNRCYAPHYDLLLHSGLYDTLIGEGLLIPHTEDPAGPAETHGGRADSTAGPAPAASIAPTPNAYKILRPRPIRPVSYPSEWSPGQLRDAALLTLRILTLATEYGMSLKDATPFNILFDCSKPVFIDTLSFEAYDPRRPWIAYRQFCECFLFPLYLHHYAGFGTDKIASAWPEGIPAGITARLLPWKSRWSPGAWMHVHLQARIAARASESAAHGAGSGEKDLGFSKPKLDRLITHLQDLVGRMARPVAGTSAWSRYYEKTVLSADYLRDKEQIFRRYLAGIDFEEALDLGCNDGRFARILAEKGKTVMAVDSDWECIDRLYRENIAAVLPLCIDLSNPTPASGFAGSERTPFTARANSDLVVALALVHHLALTNNIPLPLIAGYLDQLTRSSLIIEFIPASDPKVQLLTARKDKTLLESYDASQFEAAFSRFFHIEKKDPVPGTERTLYLMTKR